MFMRMKFRIFSLIVVLSLPAVLLPPVVIALDDPHKSGMTCATCHQNPSSTWWTDQGAAGGLCGQCHNPGFPERDAVIHAITSTYGGLVMPCTQCHNPHYQKQLRTWKAAGYLATGTISAVTTTTLTRTAGAPGWSQDQWKGMLLIPDVRYLQYNYRIASNTASVITIDTSRGDAIMLAYAAPGASFAVVYGGLIKEAIGRLPVKFLRGTGVNSFADGDATRDGVCEVCHSRTTHFRASGTAPDQLHTSIGSSAAGTRCMVCHKHVLGFPGENAGCLGCHDGPVGSRAAVGSRFRAGSHHVQGVEVTNQHCYQCHWEANDDGTINTTYHSGSSVPGSAVDLVIYGAAARPTSYTVDTTAIQYLANGSRAEINKLTTHCLGCHSDQNNATQPFGVTRKPIQYAWDGSSVANRYNQVMSFLGHIATRDLLRKKTEQGLFRPRERAREPGGLGPRRDLAEHAERLGERPVLRLPQLARFGCSRQDRELHQRDLKRRHPEGDLVREGRLCRELRAGGGRLGGHQERV
jgi:hypothetical protein